MSRNPRTDLRFTRTANSCSLPNAPVEIRHVEFVGDQVRFEVRANSRVKIRVRNSSPREFAAGLSKG